LKLCVLVEEIIMESYLFKGVEAEPDTLIVEGWHKPGSLTRASGAWIHAAAARCWRRASGSFTPTSSGFGLPWRTAR
jgi:hypothetical protein